jgi:phenylpropionate dioxygenase-like ring-hydroxylating dioxygenase large terminal subunit
MAVIDPQRTFLQEYTKTAPGTPAGDFLRRFWHPVCLSRELKDLPYPVRMLSEDLVAFRLPSGVTGLVSSRCPHRCASLEYGQVRSHGLMCSYHGWSFDTKGNCTDQPLEPADNTMKERVKILWYPTQEWAGIVWCYMGPDKQNPPPLPKLDILTRTDGEVVLERSSEIRPYSYLNFVENFVDMGHIYVMHTLAPGTVPPELRPYVNESVDINWRSIQHRVFETDFGMKSVLVHNTADEDLKFVNTWSLVMPATYRFGGITAGLPPDFTSDRRESGGVLRIIDDTHFQIFRFQLIRQGNFRAHFFPAPNDKARGFSTTGLRGTVDKKDYDFREFPAWEGIPAVEDYVLQLSQGAIPPREEEHLGHSDVGVATLRRIWRRAIEAVKNGQQPKLLQTSNEGVVETDTFKGFLKQSELVLGPINMPDSREGRGLIRNERGELAFP